MLRHNILTACFLIAIVTFNLGCCNDQEDEQLTLRDLLDTNNYDKRVRPSGVGGVGPTIVETNLYIRDIDFIDEKDQMYGVQITFRQKWQDNRLSYNSSFDSLKFLTLLDVTQIWTPDLFFSDEKESTLHDLMKPNHFIRIFPSGDILYSARISLKLSCPMAYSRFPFDTQVCKIRMASYGYIDKEVVFEWKTEDPVQISPTLNTAKFDLVEFASNRCDAKTNTGTYSCVNLDMNFSRTFRPYLLNVYIPCCTMVIVAWLGTFLNKKSVTARALIALSSLYVMATQVNQINEDLPTTGYTKAIDTWIGICRTFIFATFAEFVIITHLSKSEEDEGEQMGDNHHLRQGSIKAAPANWGEGNRNKSDKINSIFRKVYPFAFALFCAIYFLVYQV